jgi:hypothetical protein
MFPSRNFSHDEQTWPLGFEPGPTHLSVLPSLDICCSLKLFVILNPAGLYFQILAIIVRILNYFICKESCDRLSGLVSEFLAKDPEVRVRFPALQ